MSDKDIEFSECCKRAELAIKAGFEVYQKFTCSHCKARQTMENPNYFTTFGLCEECDSLTDIEAQGCGFMAVMAVRHE